MLTYLPFVLSEIENGKMKEYMPNPRAYAGAQIERMGYAREYAADNRTIYQIGCNFSSKTGTIDGWKVK